MGFIIEALIDWFWVGFMKRLADRYPPWVWVPIMISPLILVLGAVYLLIR